MPPPKRKAKSREKAPKPRKSSGRKDEEIESDFEEEAVAAHAAQSSSDDEKDAFVIEETADEKRVRLAKDILDKTRRPEDDDGEVDTNEVIAQRLQKAVIESSGKFQRKIAQKLRQRTWVDTPQRVMRGHQLSVTCVALTDDDLVAYTGSKDCTIVRYDTQTAQRTYFPGKRGDTSGSCHSDHILSVAVSSDGKLLASGGLDKMVRIWDLATNKVIKSFSGHTGAITGLAFRHGSYDLFSSSMDRLVKSWNCADMSYVETQFGHTDMVYDVDSLSRERALTCSRDHTLRLFRVLEDHHWVYRASPTISVECCRMVNEEVYISGADDGSLSLWGVNKKKPLHTVSAAHGAGRWVCSVGAWRYSDVVASGSSDGFLRLWECAHESTKLHSLHNYPITGFVNGIRIAKSGRFVLAAVGQEHRLGRWERIPAARNGLVMFEMPVTADDTE